MSTTAPAPPRRAPAPPSTPVDARQDPAPGRTSVARTAAWAAALLVLGSLSLATAWSGAVPVLALAAAAVLPLAVCRAVLRLGVSAWATSAALASLLVLAAYVLAADARTSFSETVADAVPRLLTTARPLPVAADVLVGPLLLTALVSLLVALRLEARGRVAPVVGALALYVAGALLTTGEGDPHGLLAGGTVAGALVGWVVLDEQRHRTGRRVLLALLVAAVATAVLVVSTAVRWDQPFEPRSLVDPPTTDVVASNPLAQLGAWAADPDRELLEVTGPVVPLRLVTLDTYDGAQWSTRTRFEPVTEDLAGRTAAGGADGPLLGGSTRTRTAEVEVLDLPGRWLPSPGWPTAVSLRDALVEPVSGNLYLPVEPGTDGPGSGPGATSGVSYTVTAVADEPDTSRLSSASVPYGDAMEPYLALPPLRQPLRDLADRVVEGAVTPYDRAVAIERAIHERGRLSATAVSGSQLWRITTFLLAEPGAPGARVGTAEQFATSFAVLARHAGLPTRVVVGFEPDPERSPERSPERRGDTGWTVTAGDASAWAEVYFQDLGWVAFSPTDARRAPETEETVERGDEGDGPGLGPEDGTTGTDGAEDDAPAATPVDRAGVSPGAVAAAAGVALLLVLAVLLLARAVRSARHRRRGPAGAWAEGRDALRLAGVRAPAHLTADQVAALATDRIGAGAAHDLAAATQRSAFGPPGTSAADPGTALREVRRASRAAVPLWRRWWWPFDPSVFLR
ncbi:transglutaminase-like putative cysteine protease [Nocardioides cavernae]|uniref:Transglutaminase-like putative cysteine protease n=1 Tax=Nocardioides cavernae TaxID=1921566 RepID=A0A7Y9GZD1_9ACTN|nr:transglutaminase domain-containing protein [Nocardioides cavernae]NYE35136.1 transglutaminase-like putative cysteine protease [Nocardioides cavernae]